MRNKKIITYTDVKNIKIGDSTEELVDARAFDDSIVTQYEKFDMVAYAGFDILVRETVARKLARANKRLVAYGFKLKIVYGFRALEVQTRYFNKRRAELAVTNDNLSLEALAALTHNFVAVPGVAGHVTGGAVDVTLVDNDGADCDMGTKIADYSDEDRIKTFTSGLNADQRHLRAILLNVMTAEGFAPFFGEWWHFCYGDKEWAAYYGKPRALYSPINMLKTAKILRIAGGNETVLQMVRGSGGDEADRRAGEALLKVYPVAEQAGLVYARSRKLEMAGGEFCGNASAAAAVLLANEESATVQYTVSGFKGDVTAVVELLEPNRYHVRTAFSGMNYSAESLVCKGVSLNVVDMKGIVHIVIEDDFPVETYESKHAELVEALNLRDRDAVGVIWCKRQSPGVQINPVVWVREVDTLFYESACGSGSIAAALCTGERKILQPTGEYINIEIDGDRLITECEVEVGIEKEV